MDPSLPNESDPDARFYDFSDDPDVGKSQFLDIAALTGVTQIPTAA